MLSLQQPIPLIIDARARLHLWLQKQTDARDSEVVAVATSPDSDDANGGWTMTDFAWIHDWRN